MFLTKNEHGYWEVRIKDRDRRWRSFSLHVKDLKQAKDLVSKNRIREIEQTAEMGILNKEVVSTLATGIRKMSIEDAVVHWRRWMEEAHLSPRTIGRCCTDVYAWAKRLPFRDMPVMEITREHIDRWVNDKSRPRGWSTRNQILCALRGFCGFLQSNGWILGNPAQLVRVDVDILTHMQKEFTPCVIFLEEEIAMILSATGPPNDRDVFAGSRRSTFWHAAVAIGRYTGLRLSDVACLEWSCFQTQGKIAVWTRKKDKRVELPLEPEALVKAIADIPQEDDVYLFPHQRNQAIDPYRRQALPTDFTRVCKHCGIYGKSFHGLRATYITRCQEAGIPMEHIAEAVAHASVTMTQHYVRPWANDILPDRYKGERL